MKYYQRLSSYVGRLVSVHNKQFDHFISTPSEKKAQNNCSHSPLGKISHTEKKKKVNFSLRIPAVWSLIF